MTEKIEKFSDLEHGEEYLVVPNKEIDIFGDVSDRPFYGTYDGGLGETLYFKVIHPVTDTFKEFCINKLDVKRVLREEPLPDLKLGKFYNVLFYGDWHVARYEGKTCNLYGFQDVESDLKPFLNLTSKEIFSWVRDFKDESKKEPDEIAIRLSLEEVTKAIASLGYDLDNYKATCVTAVLKDVVVNFKLNKENK
jgi:hypothetical protein